MAETLSCRRHDLHANITHFVRPYSQLKPSPSYKAMRAITRIYDHFTTHYTLISVKGLAFTLTGSSIVDCCPWAAL